MSEEKIKPDNIEQSPMEDPRESAIIITFDGPAMTNLKMGYRGLVSVAQVELAGCHLLRVADMMAREDIIDQRVKQKQQELVQATGSLPPILQAPGGKGRKKQ